MTANVSELLTTKRRESFLNHAYFAVADSLKKDLMVTPGTGPFLFNKPLLLYAIDSMKEDSLLSSTSALASLSKAAKGRGQGSSSRSPLDFARPGTSGYRKRPASPSRRGSKRGRGGRGVTPFSSKG